jgi:hypothetical protein
MFDRGVPLPFYFGVRVQTKSICLPLVGRVWYPSNVDIIADPNVQPNNRYQIQQME